MEESANVSNCEEKVDVSQYLSMQVILQDVNETFQCGECGQLLPDCDKLREHQTFHGGEKKNNMCSLCGKMFTRKSDLTPPQPHPHGGEALQVYRVWQTLHPNQRPQPPHPGHTPGRRDTSVMNVVNDSHVTVI
ncbi:hypothetical protein Pcinc_004738 [Petrolisthes cinctipes]|uniref:C2H2-type domain-containing protein n=1 Tax=Petrolisthes cinctipes TaxID=88211 RepID=A0AAE1GGL7_PETCI|nr:hypothetical protein Pcinc_004738 [Petrolisthes cinctipes]